MAKKDPRIPRESGLAQVAAASLPEYGADLRRNWLAIGLLVLAATALVGGVTGAALWEPYEVSVAELSRRIGFNLLGGASLGLPGADDSVPIRADLGRGELPFTSAALGLRLFGLSSWAGRLPLSLWALAALLVLYAAVARLWDRRAASYAALVLATTPLYFLQARTLLGDAVTLASFAIAWSGLAVSLLTPRQSVVARVGFAVLGCVGLYAGFWCRGPIVGVAVPAGAVALAALSDARGATRAFALGLTVLAAAALMLGVQGLSLSRATGEYSVFVGSALGPPEQLPTFEAAFTSLVHACFPWSALAPLPLAMLWSEARDEQGSERARVVSAAALALGGSLIVSGWLSASLGPVLPAGVACLAVLVGVSLSEVEAGRLGSPLLGVAVAAAALLIGFDLRTYPDAALAGYGLHGATFPEALQSMSGRFWLASGLLLAVVSASCLSEREPETGRLRRFDRSEYAGALTALQRTWDGNLVFALLVLEAGLVGFLLLSAISERVVPIPQLESFGSFTRQLVALSAIAVPLSALVPLGAMFVRDLVRACCSDLWPGPLRPFSLTRAQGLLCAGALLGLCQSAWFYPKLSRQLSPSEVFERYRELSRGSEPLGMLAQQGAAAVYQGGAHSAALADVDAAFTWLGGGQGGRRWLVLRKTDLPELNARFREQHARNLPILDARSSELLLASDRLIAGERNESPLAPLLLDAAPRPEHPLHAVLDGKLELLGWSLQSSTGESEQQLAPSTSYRLVVFYRVLAPLHGAWQAFVHLDGLQRRFNADHELLDGKYPTSLWRPGDVLADSAEVLLEPNFSPGRYRLYFGLFSPARRLAVTEGPAEDDRILGGVLQVR